MEWNEIIAQILMTPAYILNWIAQNLGISVAFGIGIAVIWMLRKIK